MKNELLCLTPAESWLAEPAADYYRRNRVFLKGFEPVREERFFTADGQREVLEKELGDREAGRGYRFYIQPAERPHHIIGVIGLNNVVWGAFRSAFLGYKLDRDYVNRGYMTAAVSMLVDYAFQELHLHRIEANVMPRNHASLRVLEKNGFVCEGLSRYYLQINGVWEDHVHMVKLNDAMHRPPDGTGARERKPSSCVFCRSLAQ